MGNTERSTSIMFNNYLYEKAVRDRNKDIQREMEQLHVLTSLQQSRHSRRRHIVERVGIFLIELGMKLKQGARLEADAQ
jgi:hypothetical protein